MVTSTSDDTRRGRRLALGLTVSTVLHVVAGLAAGSDAWSLPGLLRTWKTSEGALIILEIRAPRTLGAWRTGAILGLSGATAQGLFRNPLADPYLLGSASGALLGVVLVLAAGALGGHVINVATADVLARLGLVGAAFVGARSSGVLLTLSLARGAQETTRLLLAGVVVGVVLSALSDLVTSAAPGALSGKQAFLLGSTGYLGWSSCLVLALGVVVTLPVSWRLCSRALDALTLGADSAASQGLRVASNPRRPRDGVGARDRPRGVAGRARRVRRARVAAPGSSLRAGHARLHGGGERRAAGELVAPDGRCPRAHVDRAAGGSGGRAHGAAGRRLSDPGNAWGGGSRGCTNCSRDRSA